MASPNKEILLLGSGFVAKPAAEYILRRPENCLTIACRHIAAAQELAKCFGERARAATVDATNEDSLDKLVSQHDLVVSLIPYIHHASVIRSAIKHKKHVVTTSYVSPAMMALDKQAKEAGIVVMNEIGMDPGIDHLYAIKTIDEVHRKGGKILSFLSYCGGLPAPEVSNNPLGYKFSWSSRGVLLALKNTARFWEDGKIVEVDGKDLMDSAKPIAIYSAFAFVGYANRDSTPYRDRYNIPEAHTIIRGTLRYSVFPKFVKCLVDMGFLDETPQPYLAEDAEDLTWAAVLAKMLDVEVDIRTVERAIKETIVASEEEKERIVAGIRWLGLTTNNKVIRRGNLLDTLCAVLEERMTYGEGERDMVILQHKFDVELKDSTKQLRTSTLLAYGDPNGDSAMARLVGIPCGIAVQLILDEKIKETGILAPMTPELNDPIMEILEKEGIRVIEEIL